MSIKEKSEEYKKEKNKRKEEKKDEAEINNINKKTLKENWQPDLPDEEWECENDFCKNINSHNTHFCLSIY